MHKVVENALTEIVRAETYSQLQDIIDDLATGLGYPYYGYQYWPGTANYGDPDFSGVVQANYPEAWQQRYVDQGYYDNDPVRLQGIEREGIIDWHLIPRWTSDQETVMQDAYRYGLQHGVVASFHENLGGRLQLTFAGKEGDGDSTLSKDALTMIAPALLVCFRRAHKLEEKLKWLTARQRDVFMLWRKGERRENIAETLSVTVRQVDRHIARIKERTSVNALADID